MLEEPPAAVARLAKALFALDTLIDARTTLLGNEPLADPDGIVIQMLYEPHISPQQFK